MKRKTVLAGDGNRVAIKITVESVSDGSLMRDEHETRHNQLVEDTLLAMTKNGVYAHKVKVS
jgi:hypothetical protein